MNDKPSAGAVWKTATRAFIAVLIGAVFLWPVVPARAVAAAQCAPHKVMVRFLLNRFDETPRAIGMIDDRRIMQVFAAPGGSWTILVTTSAGQSCILAAGKGFEGVPPPSGEGMPPDRPGDPA